VTGAPVTIYTRFHLSYQTHAHTQVHVDVQSKHEGPKTQFFRDGRQSTPTADSIGMSGGLQLDSMLAGIVPVSEVMAKAGCITVVSRRKNWLFGLPGLVQGSRYAQLVLFVFRLRLH
jgi:hypothetical protein